MKVLHLYAGNLYGGIETLLATLAREKNACPALISEFGLCFEGRLQTELESAGAAVHRLGKVRLSRPWTVWSARRRLYRMLRASAPDAVVTHACWPHAVFAPAVRKAKVPLLLWCHDFLNSIHRIERRAALTPPDRVIANSHHTASSVGSVFPGVPVETTYYPIRPAAGDVSKRDSLRDQTNTPRNAVVILIACRFEEWKGHSLLLDALGRLGENGDWVCWAAGGVQRPHERAYVERLQDQAKRLGISGRIRWLGQRNDVPDLLAAADVHCQPNLGPEPFGIAFVEALYAGRPSVSTRQGGAAEVIDDSCGILVGPGQAGELAQALARLIGDCELRCRLGNGGPSRARSLCDPATQLSKLAEMFADLKQTRDENSSSRAGRFELR